MSCYQCALAKPQQLACSYDHVRVIKRTTIVLKPLAGTYVFDPKTPKTKFFTLRGKWE